MATISKLLLEHKKADPLIGPTATIFCLRRFEDKNAIVPGVGNKKFLTINVGFQRIGSPQGKDCRKRRSDFTALRHGRAGSRRHGKVIPDKHGVVLLIGDKVVDKSRLGNRVA